MAKKAQSSDVLTPEQLMRADLGVSPVGDSKEAIAALFGDMVPDPNSPTGYRSVPLKPGDIIIGDDNQEYTIPEPEESPTPEPAPTVVPPAPPTPEPTPQPTGDKITVGDLPTPPKPGEIDYKSQYEALMAQLQGMQDRIPDRLRRDNPVESIVEAVKSYKEAEKKISEQGETVKRLSALIGGTPTSPQYNYPVGYYHQYPGQSGYGMGNQPQSQYQGSPQPTTLSEAELAVTDEDFLSKPKEATVKVMGAMLNQVGPSFVNTVLQQIDNRDLARFRMLNPEWDQLWATGEVQAILRANRHLDNPAGMSEALQKARELRQIRMEEEDRRRFGGTNPSDVGQVVTGLGKLTEMMNTVTARLENLEKGGIANPLDDAKLATTVERVLDQRAKNKAASIPQPVASGGGATHVASATPKQPTPDEADLTFVKEIANAKPGQHDLYGRKITDGPYSEPGADAAIDFLSGKHYHELETVR